MHLILCPQELDKIDMMSIEDQPRSELLNEDDLRVALGRAANSKGIHLTPHAKCRARERNLAMDDFIHALRYSGWSQNAEPVFDAEHRNWEYSIASQDIDGEPLQLKVAFKFDREIVEVITAW